MIIENIESSIKEIKDSNNKKNRKVSQKQDDIMLPYENGSIREI